MDATKNNESTNEASEGNQFSPTISFNSLKNSNSLHLNIYKSNGKNYIE